MEKVFDSRTRTGYVKGSVVDEGSTPNLDTVRQGPKGDIGLGVADALMIATRLAEFNTPAAKSAARTNLELEVIDLGTFN